MGWRSDFYWALPPEADYETVAATAEMLQLDRELRRLRRLYLWLRFRRWIGNMR